MARLDGYKWENDLLQAKKDPLKWVSGKLEIFSNSCRDELFFEECIFIGKLLELADGFEIATFSKEKLERFTDFSTTKIVSCHKSSQLIENLKLQGSRVLITTHEKLTKIDIDELKKISISSIIVDEAQKLHKEGTDAHRFYQKLTRSFSKEKRPAILLASGTPLENHFSELYTLLDLCNPHEFSVSTYNTLNLLFEETKKGLIQEISKGKSKIDFEESLIRSFAQFEIFRRFIVKPMIGRLNKSSPQVISAWKNLIPSRTDHRIEGHMSEEAAQVFEKLERDYKTMNLFEYTKITKVVLLDPALKGSFSLKNQEIQKIITDLKTPQFDALDLFQRSPLLHSLLTSGPLIEAINKKERSVIVTEHRATAKIIKHAISKKFSDFNPDIKVFHGSLNSEKREAKIKWFRSGDTDRPKFFILMAKAGGVGLNLPEGNKVFMATMDWNPAVDEQVVSRVLRVGNPGDKHIYWINYNMFFQHQQKAIQESKKMLENFFFNDDDSVKNQFTAWCNLLESSCYHACLIHKRNLAAATIQREEMQDLLKEKIDKTPELKLQQAIDGCLPKRAASVITDYPQLTMKQCVIIPTTIQNGSWTKTVAFGYSLKICMQEKPEQMQKFLKDLNLALNQHPEWRQEIRQNSFVDKTNFINTTFLKIKEKRPSEKELFLQTDFRIEFYQPTSDGKLARYNIVNESKTEVIRLYKKVIEKNNHYDLISLL